MARAANSRLPRSIPAAPCPAHRTVFAQRAVPADMHSFGCLQGNTRGSWRMTTEEEEDGGMAQTTAECKEAQFVAGEQK